MEVIQDFTTIDPVFRGAVLAIGNFDGVHRGHKQVIDVARERADYFGVPVGVLTFEPHPQEFFRPEKASFRLTPLEAKARIMHRIGVDVLFAAPFNQGMASTSPQHFIDSVLLRDLATIHVVAGYDFHFGHKRAGDPAVLAYMGEMEGLGVTIVDRVVDDGDPARTNSSTEIRDFLRGGKPKDAARLLGHPWFIEQRVEAGDARGRGLGFPTANLSLSGLVEPAHGVYAVRVTLPGPAAYQPGQVVEGIANLGPQPTFGSDEVRLEAFLFDFEGDLYGKHLTVELIDYVRPVQKFDGPDALKAQIAKDIETARAQLAAATGDPLH
ncbi:MAG: bifunctional riboflavin kinase/FAD synthetase [Pseudomonadota bacterium]